MKARPGSSDIQVAELHLAYTQLSVMEAKYKALKKETMQVRKERDRFRAVLEGAEYRNLNLIVTLSIKAAKGVGRLAASRTKEMIGITE